MLRCIQDLLRALASRCRRPRTKHLRRALLPLRVVAWTRVPYLSTGTTEQSYYHLDNALIVLRRTGV